MVGMRIALVVGLVVGGAACGRGESDRSGRFCARYEHHRAAGGVAGDPAEVLAEEARLVRLAPDEIADEVAVVAASHRAVAEGTGPVVTAERLDAAEVEIDRWVADSCA